jgi:hypothetical protein
MTPLESKLPPEHFTREPTPAKGILSSPLIISAVVLGLVAVSIVLSLLVYTSVSSLTDSVNVQTRTNARTECIRTINNQVNDERWDHVYDALSHSGDKTAQQKSIRDGVALNGVITRRIAKECPAEVTDN